MPDPTTAVFNDHGMNETELVPHPQSATPAVDPREVCANVCHSRASNWADIGMNELCREAHDCAAAIRALPPFAAQPQSEAVKRLCEAAREVLGNFTERHLDSVSGTKCGTRLRSALAAVEKYVR